MDYTQKTDEQLTYLLNETAAEASKLYRLKKEILEELQKRSIPQNAELYVPSETPGGLTVKQIKEIRLWAKTRHTTDELIAYITQIVQGQQP